MTALPYKLYRGNHKATEEQDNQGILGGIRNGMSRIQVQL